MSNRCTYEYYDKCTTLCYETIVIKAKLILKTGDKMRKIPMSLNKFIECEILEGSRRLAYECKLTWKSFSDMAAAIEFLGSCMDEGHDFFKTGRSGEKI